MLTYKGAVFTHEHQFNCLSRSMSPLVLIIYRFYSTILCLISFTGHKPFSYFHNKIYNRLLQHEPNTFASYNLTCIVT